MASQPKDSAACVITWQNGIATADLVTYPLTDAQILELTFRADMTGIDVPFGWPQPLIDAVSARRDTNAWPDGDTRWFVFRTADIWVKEMTGQQPLSVAADKIGWPAVRAARLLAALEAKGVAVERSGVRGKIVEVYPAAALRRWGLPHAKYKGKRGRETLRALAEALFRRNWLRFATGARDAYCTNDHCLDALVAALVARAHACELCETVPEEHSSIARIEGWIALPRAQSLDALPLDPG